MTIARPFIVTTLLGAYGLWYLVMVGWYFKPSVALWGTAVGMGFCVGSIHHLNFLTGAANQATIARSRRGMIIRFFLVPFCVASLSSLLRGKPVILIFPMEWENYRLIIPILGAWAGLWLWQRHRQKDPASNNGLLRWVVVQPALALLVGYGLYYLCLVFQYFAGFPRLWLNSLGIALVLGIALNLNALVKGSGRSVLGKRMVVLRFYLIPFAVSSFAGLTADQSFTAVFSSRLRENLWALSTVGLWLLMRGFAGRNEQDKGRPNKVSR